MKKKMILVASVLLLVGCSKKVNDESVKNDQTTSQVETNYEKKEESQQEIPLFIRSTISNFI